MAGRIVLLVTSPRLPAGLLTAGAWDLVRAHPVLTAAETPQAAALRAAGARVTVTDRGLDDLLAAVATEGTVVWLSSAGPAASPPGSAGPAASPPGSAGPAAAAGAADDIGPAGTSAGFAGRGGDEALARALGLRLAREPGLAGLEVVYGSWDPPGARLLDAVAVMDRLASPGGDPWKRQQTHRSLAKYMIEEAYEAVDAIDADDLGALRDELGDVLLQVVLHARLAENLPEGAAWNVDDVAGGLVDKMIRRNPHVFADATPATVDEITDQWEQIKREERAGRGPFDGLPLGQPALSLAAKIQARAARAGLPLAAPGSDLGERLWALVEEASEQGLDPEAELRRVALARLAQARSGDPA